MATSSTGIISGDGPNSVTGKLIFNIVLTPSDVTGPLVIPKNAEKHFPGVSENKLLLLPFTDPAGKTWLFRCSFSDGRYKFSYGWAQFVTEKELVAGDTVSFWRVVKKDGGKDLWYVNYERVGDFGVVHQLFDEMPQRTGKQTGVAHQVFDEMPQRVDDETIVARQLFDEMAQRDGDNSGVSNQVFGEMSKPEEERENMFDVVLTPSDVSSRLKRLVVRKEHGEKHFPAVSPNLGSSTSSSSRRKHLLSFIDPTGKTWQFMYSHSTSSQDFVISKGWIKFVKQKKLGAGDMVTFWRGRKKGGEQDFSYYINCTRCSGEAKKRKSCKAVVKPRSSSSGSCLTFQSNASLNTPHGFVDLQLGSELSGERADDRKLRELGQYSTEHYRALLYCTLFPEDYDFEKDTMIQLWMAGGLFEEEPFEYFAGQVFDSLLCSGYILCARNEMATRNAFYKFNANNFVDLVSSGSHIIINDISKLSDVSAEASHVSLRCGSNMKSINFDGIKRFKQLQTLLFVRGHESTFKHVPRDLLLSLELLRALDLSRTHISELPSSIANIKCLRYLDMSFTPIKRLPETTDCLSKLQTLKLNGCSNLSRLPKGMRKLVNLRHLNFDVLRQLHTMPQGIGTLTSLRTLSAFLVGEEVECSIQQLKNMNSLMGSFCISRLENVLNREEATDAHLSDKQDLRKLELHWSESRDEDILGDDEVLSSLKPNASLEELVILCYCGYELPTWICDPSFSNLVSITFFKCKNCLILPSLGKLPALKLLNIVELQKVKMIDNHFCGEIDLNQGYNAFPKLEKLTFEFMFGLEEWSEMRSYGFPSLRNLTIKHCPKLLRLCTMTNLSSLEYLEISCCPVLASFPDGKLPASVETLIIEHCPPVSARCLKDGPDWPKVEHIPNVWVDHQQVST